MKDFKRISKQGEEWRNYHERYWVSNLGRVASDNYKNSGSLNILSLSKDRNGYVRAMIIVNKKQKSVSVHRMVATCFIPNPFNKPCVNHKDGVKHNNNLQNLEWVTYRENEDHALRMGLKGVGINGNGSCSLSHSELLKLWEDFNGTTIEFSKMHKISRMHFYRIRKANGVIGT